jgi:catechol 2,3-dioxygenase-like lactoylglutathione lyase family enzyme
MTVQNVPQRPIIASSPVGKRPTPTSHLRIARPCRDLEVARRFWVDGLGLSTLWRSPPASQTEGGHELLMVGWPGAAWHVELVQILENEMKPTPSEEDLLVLYVDGQIDSALVESLVQAGGRRVSHSNEYWNKWGVTIADMDGYLLVLCMRAWENQ